MTDIEMALVLITGVEYRTKQPNQRDQPDGPGHQAHHPDDQEDLPVHIHVPGGPDRAPQGRMHRAHDPQIRHQLQPRQELMDGKMKTLKGTIFQT